MGYSDDKSMVRVDIWKQSGKWYETIALKWDRYSFEQNDGSRELIHDIFRRCMQEQYPNYYIGMKATCLEPYHEHSHPIMIDL